MAEVLVVDDDPPLRYLFCTHLENMGFKADAACNGQEAVDLNARQQYRLILMDINMPQLDGYKASCLIRKRERELNLQPVPIVAITSFPSAAKCDDSCINAVYEKPVRMAQLQQVVREWLSPDGKGD